jgi:hypothetical protein|nr:MAG TPA: hypothetical protein [Bacteriophage sp.]
MIVKMMITFDYDPETNEYKPLKQEIVKDKVQKATKAEEAEDSAEPQITLEANKYVLNKAAATLMGVEWENRLDIKYQPVEKGGMMFPIIGTDTAWKTKSGNKLTKSLTVSCRGNANELLSKYGDTFTVTPWKGHEGLFVMIGNKDRSEEEPTIKDDNISIREDENPVEDLPLDTELDNEEAYKIDDLSFEI